MTYFALPGDMTGGEEVPLLLARLMRLSRAFTPLLRVLAAPSASARSVSALRLARLLGPLLMPGLTAVSLPRRDPDDCATPGLESVTSLAILMAETCHGQHQDHDPTQCVAAMNECSCNLHLTKCWWSFGLLSTEWQTWCAMKAL